MKKLCSYSIISAIALAMAPAVHAQSAATYSTGDFTDNTVLNLVGLSSSEVYGVSWVGSTSQTTANNFTFGPYSAGNLTYGNGTYGGFNVTTTGDAAFNTILSSACVAGPSGSPNLTLDDLALGVTYDALILDADDRSGIGGPRALTISDGITSTFTGDQWITADNTAVVAGSYILATFTATSSTEAFTIGGPGGPQINAVLVTTVPEPSTYALAASSGIGLLLLRRKKPKQATLYRT
jgi:hypothetical protein